MNNPIVAILAPGAMGAGVGKRLIDHGVQVWTLLAGRSSASRKRATDAGMIDTPEQRIIGADFILSIVPPSQALPMAERLAGLLAQARHKPIYVDCNAVSPKTVEHIGTLFEDICPFVDAGIIGGPPKSGLQGPRFYSSGMHTARFAALRDFGLDVRLLEGPIGAASALKMSYAGITKGLTALGSAMMLAATRAGAAQALHTELAQSQPALLTWLTRQIPPMFPKAYRWVGEMEEIADFLAEDKGASRIFGGAAELYDRLAQDFTGGKQEASALTDFLAKSNR
ncbi:MAG TPA: DUF1932 domain-containing protein [Xanthobacteraceae bacterium]|jgi:3-hydroxyisobutyrate dehydrogenase-like beta-hydroxyacid dehydrogenase|nr:DUF1932 domain-containing protein [Xanthobacteraceae bacterium]